MIDALDRLWILDTGRVLTASGVLVPATYGGPKLVGVNLATNTVFQTIVFPPTVAYGDSYLNDVRLDLRSGLSDTSGRGGVAYITDSSASGHSGLIVADLGTGESWRHLGLTRAVGAESQFLPFVWGQAGYYADNAGTPYTGFPIGSDGIALSADGDTLYWCPLASRYMYSVPTARLRARGAASELLAQQAVVSHGQKGVSDGLETDSNGMVYVGSMEGNAINVFNPGNGTTLTFVRDPRINWVDTSECFLPFSFCLSLSHHHYHHHSHPTCPSFIYKFILRHRVLMSLLVSVANDGYLYFTVNQLNFASSTFPGTDRRVRPFALFRVKLPNGGSKVSLV